jgi:Spy/CpxP family protein refolding chaperone
MKSESLRLVDVLGAGFHMLRRYTLEMIFRLEQIKMFRNLFFTAAALAAIFAIIGARAETGQKTGNKFTSPYTSPYRGQEARRIKSLSEKDVDDLVNGRGWGFAKSAELNGLPGPAHILEMAEAIGLTAEQRQAVTALFKDMKGRAVPLGKKLVALEAGLDRLFTGYVSGAAPSESALKSHLSEIGRVRSDLRHVHLATHLKTPKILTPHQIAAYNRLRGYSGGSMDHSKMGAGGHGGQGGW